MKKWLVRFVLNGLALLLVSYLFESVVLDGFWTALVAAFILGLVNTFVRPLLILFTLPVTVLTLGLFILVINTATFALTAWLIPGFEVNSFTGAIFAPIVLSIISWLLHSVITERIR